MMKFAQALRRMRKEEKGFTLVELMVVVVIIGILAAVAIPKFSQIIDQSKYNADVATGKVLKDAVDRYYQNNSNYPTTIAELMADANGVNYINGSTAPVSAQVPGYTPAVVAVSTTTPIVWDSATGVVTVLNVKDTTKQWQQ